MKQRSEAFYGSLIFLQSLLVGVGNPIAKYGMSEFPFFLYVAIRFLLGSIVLFVIFNRKIRNNFKISFLKPATLIAVFTAGAYIVGTLCFKYTTATNAGFLFAMPVVFTPFLMLLISKTKVPKKQFIPILIVIVGLYFLCCGNGGFRLGLGEALAILSAFLAACVFEFSSKYLKEVEPLFLAAYQAGFTGIVCMILSAVNAEGIPVLTDISINAWGALLYLGVICTGVSYCLQNSALSKLDSTKVALITCSQPVFTTAASFLLLGERMTAIQAVGAVIIMGSIIWASLMQK